MQKCKVPRAKPRKLEPARARLTSAAGVHVAVSFGL